MTQRRVLIVVAHPDDEVLGCGGVMARHADRGDAVTAMFVADGVGARGGRADELTKRRKSCRRALACLSAQEPFFLDFEDQRLDAVPLLDVTVAIEKVGQALQPDVVYTHHAGDLNLDHRIVAQAVLTAFRPLPGQTVKRIYGFETLSSTEWAFGGMAPVFAPSRFVDIQTTFVRKMEALAAYDAEMRDFPHARSHKAVEALATLRGATVGVPYAEAFVVMREVVA